MAQEAIVLASASPRRSALLSEAGLSFDVRPSDVDETLVGAPEPEGAAADLARRKARAACEMLSAEDQERWLIGADTIVAVPTDSPPGRAAWRLLGKPADEVEARAMLRSLSGTTHHVVTGVCVARTGGSDAGRMHCATETTAVTMRELTDREIEGYVASGEWRDKAGGYAIQETADRFVTELSGGGFDNVVGLPVGLTLELEQEYGLAGPILMDATVL